MSEVDWDALARKAENTIGAELARLTALNDAGHLTHILIVSDELNLKGASLLSYYHQKGDRILAIGMAEYAAHGMLVSYDGAGLSPEEVEDLEPDD